MSGCCLTPSGNFSAIPWRYQVRTKCNDGFDDYACLVLNHHVYLDVYGASILRKKFQDE